MKKLFLILIGISLYTFAFGQSFALKGIVSSTDGELLPGVNVRLKGATIGTITNLDGQYQINVKIGDVLEFSYIGFKKQEVSIKGKKDLNIVLSPDQTDLEEVVVVGYLLVNCVRYQPVVSKMHYQESCLDFLASNVQDSQVKMLPIFLFVVSVR